MFIKTDGLLDSFLNQGASLSVGDPFVVHCPNNAYVTGLSAIAGCNGFTSLRVGSPLTSAPDTLGCRLHGQEMPSGFFPVYFWVGQGGEGNPGVLQRTANPPRAPLCQAGTVLEGAHLLTTPLPSLPDKSCRTLWGVGSWNAVSMLLASERPQPRPSLVQAC